MPKRREMPVTRVNSTNRKRLAVALIAACAFGSCASLQITTWIMKKGELVHGLDKKQALEAEGYRCYSEADDSAWRQELKIQKICCDGAHGL